MPKLAMSARMRICSPSSNGVRCVVRTSVRMQSYQAIHSLYVAPEKRLEMYLNFEIDSEGKSIQMKQEISIAPSRTNALSLRRWLALQGSHELLLRGHRGCPAAFPRGG